MAARRHAYISYVNADTYASPTSAPDPWFADASNSGALTHDGVDTWTLTADSGESQVYYKRFDAGATSTYDGPLRTQDDLELQFVCAVNTAGSVAADDYLVFFLFDGSRAAYIEVSDVIQYTGATGETQTVRPSDFNSAEAHVYHFRKVGRERWQLYIDGILAIDVPYIFSTIATGTEEPAFASIGVVGTTETVTASLKWLEVGCNMPLPPQWKVDNHFAQLHPSVQRNFTADTRAMIRAGVGQMWGATAGLREIRNRIGAGRVQLGDTYRFDGDVLPDEVSPAWTLAGSQYTVIRERVRADGASGTGTMTAALGDLAEDDQIIAYVRARLKVESYSAGLNALVCHPLTIKTEHVYAKASIYEVGATAAGTQFAWTIREGDASTGQPSITGRYWNIDPYQDMQAELVCVADRCVLLIINGTVVDWAEPADFSSTAGTPRQAILTAGTNSSAGGDAVVHFWDAEAGVYGVDIARRPIFEEMCVEDLVFVGGCECNAVLDIFDRHRYGMLEIRGSTRGIYLDIRRLTCQKHVYLIEETTSAGWFADATYPDETPVFLDATDTYTDTFVEFAAWPPNYTLTDFCDMLARYIVPMSVKEGEYWLCLIAVATASISAGSSVAVAVISSAGFEIGDSVKLRSFDNATSEQCNVTAIGSSTSITLDVVSNSYSHSSSAPPIIRKVIRGT